MRWCRSSASADGYDLTFEVEALSESEYVAIRAGAERFEHGPDETSCSLGVGKRQKSKGKRQKVIEKNMTPVGFEPTPERLRP